MTVITCSSAVFRLMADTSRFTKPMKRATAQMKKSTAQVQGYAMSFQGVNQKQKQVAEGMTDVSKKAKASQERVTKGSQKFRYELLSVMFFGMMLTRVFGGMLNPIAEVYGLFDLLRWVFIDMTIGLMDDFYDDIINLTEALTSLDPSVKKAASSLAVFGLVVGIVLTYIGAISLGIEGIKKAFPTLIGGLGKVSGALKSVGLVGGTLAAVLAIITVVLVGIWLAWEDNWRNIQVYMANFWAGLEMAIEGALDIITGIIDLALAMISGDFEAASVAWDKIADGIQKFLVGLVGAAISIIQVIITAIARVLYGLGVFLGKVLVAITAWISDAASKFVAGGLTMGADFVEAIAQGIRNAANSVKSALQGVIDLLPGPLKDLFNAIWDTGGSILSLVTGGVSSSARKAASNITSGNSYIQSQAVAALANPITTTTTSSGTSYGQSAWYGPGDSRNVVTPAYSPLQSQVVNNFYGFTQEDLKVTVDESNQKLLDDIARGVYP